MEGHHTRKTEENNMVYLDVYVPAISQKIEVRADEEKNIGRFKEELCLLLKKMLGEEEKIISGFELFDDAQKELLSDERTLSECGISGGSRLLLI